MLSTLQIDFTRDTCSNCATLLSHCFNYRFVVRDWFIMNFFSFDSFLLLRVIVSFVSSESLYIGLFLYQQSYFNFIFSMVRDNSIFHSNHTVLTLLTAVRKCGNSSRFLATRAIFLSICFCVCCLSTVRMLAHCGTNELAVVLVFTFTCSLICHCFGSFFFLDG